MNNDTHSTADSGPTLTGSDEGKPASGSRIRKSVVFICKYWWIPVIVMAVSLGSTAIVFRFMPPVYVSSGALWETQKLRLPETAGFREDRDIYLGAQSELLRSRLLREMALNLIRSSDTNEIILDQDGKPLPVDIQVFGSPKSSVYTIEAQGSHPGFTRAFLNALMQAYLDFRRNTRLSVSGETMASISEQVQRVEKNLKMAQDALAEYEGSNNFAVLQVQGKVAVDCLARLNSQLSDLQLEDLLPDHPPLSGTETAQHRTLQLKMEHIQNSIKDWNSKIVAADRCSAEVERLQQNIRRCQRPYDRLTALLEDFDINRNIDQGSLNVLEPAFPAKRSYTREQRALFFAGLGGLVIGLGIKLLMQLACARRCSSS